MYNRHANTPGDVYNVHNIAAVLNSTHTRPLLPQANREIMEFSEGTN